MRALRRSPALPRVVRPMRGVCGPVPSGDGWSVEPKWGGMRAVTYVDRGQVRVLSGDERDVTAAVPELRAIGSAIEAQNVVLDGGLVALDDHGLPSIDALQCRLHPLPRCPHSEVPVTLHLFDVLHFDGRPQLHASHEDRRGLLDSLHLDGPHWSTPRSIDPGVDPMQVASSLGAEGVIAKRRDSPYLAGRRTHAWITTRLDRVREVVIGGWIPGTRSGGVAAVLVGAFEHDGTRLRYLGQVSRGLGALDAALLAQRFEQMRRHSSPFLEGLPSAVRAAACWVAPGLCAEVCSTQPGSDGLLRDARWVGLRLDKDPADLAA